MDKVEINNRFLQAIDSLLKDKGLSKAGIAQSLDMKPSKFTEILKGRMNAGTDTIALLCEQFSFNPSWVLLGQGTMLNPGELKGRSKPAIAVSNLPDFPLTSDGVCQMFMEILRDRDLAYKEQAEEIGTLKERIRILEREKERLASAVRTSSAANAG